MADTDHGTRTATAERETASPVASRTEKGDAGSVMPPAPQHPTDERQRVCLISFDAVSPGHPFERHAKSLVAAGIDCEIICTKGTYDAEADVAVSVEPDANDTAPEVGRHENAAPSYHHIPLLGHRSGPLRGLAVLGFLFAVGLRLILKYRGGRPAIVQIDQSSHALILLALQARAHGAAVVAFVDAPEPESLASSTGNAAVVWRALARVWESLLRRATNRIIVPTREVRDRLGERGADRERVVPVANLPEGRLDRLGFQRFRVAEMAKAKRAERRKGVFRIVAFEREADPDMWALLVPALSDVLDRIPGAELCVLATPGPSGMKLQNIIRPRLAERIRRVEVEDFDTEVNELLTADIGIVAPPRNALNEVNIPELIFELAALEKPVIAPRLTALGAYFPEETVLYFRPENARDLSDQIYHAYAYPKEMASRAAKTHELMSAYRWPRESRKYVTLVETLSATLQAERAKGTKEKTSEDATPESQPASAGSDVEREANRPPKKAPRKRRRSKKAKAARKAATGAPAPSASGETD